MKKTKIFQQIILLFFISISAEAAFDKFDLKVDLINDDYRIVPGCAPIGDKILKIYVLQFKSDQFVSRDIGLVTDHVAFEGLVGDIKIFSAGLTQSTLEIFVDEPSIKSLLNHYSGNFTLVINPYMIKEKVLSDNQLAERFLSSLQGKNYNQITSMDVFETSNTFIRVPAKKHELSKLLDECSNRIKIKLDERKEAIHNLENDAKSGDLDAKLELAMHYLSGDWVLKDEKKGLDLIKDAANGGNPKAQLSLGLYYASDDSGKMRDLKKAKIWVQKSYQNGFEPAKEVWNEYELWKY